MDAANALQYILLGALLGMIGQGARVVVGLKKSMEGAKQGSKGPASRREWFDLSRLLISLVLGAIAGAIAIVVTQEPHIGKGMMLGIMGAGYSGADFIEGFMTKNMPKA